MDIVKDYRYFCVSLHSFMLQKYFILESTSPIKESSDLSIFTWEPARWVMIYYYFELFNKYIVSKYIYGIYNWKTSSLCSVTCKFCASSGCINIDISSRVYLNIDSSKSITTCIQFDKFSRNVQVKWLKSSLESYKNNSTQDERKSSCPPTTEFGVVKLYDRSPFWICNSKYS